MRLTTLAVENFRCHALARLELPSGRPVALVGPNGGGKTSLLEAAYLLATRKSFRTAQLPRLIRRGHAAAAARGMWSAEKSRPQAREARLSSKGAQFLYDDRPLPRGLPPPFIPVVAFCREFLIVLTGPPEARRRYLDRGLAAAQPDYVRAAAALRRAAREKQLALTGNPATLRAINQALALHAYKVQRARALLVERLNQALPPLAAEFAGDDPELQVPLSLAYRPSPPALEDLLSGETANYKKSFHASLEEERRRGFSLVGPQRDELAILWDGRPVTQASGGQQRLALYLLSRAVVEVLARRYGADPLFLYDDADAELDDARLKALLASLARAPGQLILTAKREAVVELLELPSARFRVEKGKVTAAP